MVFQKTMNEIHRGYLAHIKSTDPKLYEVSDAIGELPLIKPSQPLESLVNAIVSQQLSTKAAATIYKRFQDMIPDPFTANDILTCTEEELRSVGLSRQKTSYLFSLAEFFKEEKEIETLWESEDETIIKALMSVKGIGVWTAQMFLMFHLGRPDVFAPDDLGIQGGMRKIYGISEDKKQMKKEMTEISERWSPYRSLACRYIWRVYESK